MLLPGAAVFLRHFLPSAFLSSRPEEIGTRFFFRQTAAVSFNGRFHRGIIPRQMMVSKKDCAMAREGLDIKSLRQSICWDQVSAKMRDLEEAVFLLLVTVMVAQSDVLRAGIEAPSGNKMDCRKIVLHYRDGQINVYPHVLGKLSEKSQFSCAMINR